MRLLGTGRLADQIVERLGDNSPGPVVVAGDARVAKALARRGVKLQEVEESELDSLEPGAATAAVIASAARSEDGVEQIRALCRAVGPGGVVVLLDKGQRIRASHCALLGGLSRLRQDIVARTVVTSGRVVS